MAGLGTRHSQAEEEPRGSTGSTAGIWALPPCAACALSPVVWDQYPLPLPTILKSPFLSSGSQAGQLKVNRCCKCCLCAAQSPWWQRVWTLEPAVWVWIPSLSPPALRPGAAKVLAYQFPLLWNVKRLGIVSVKKLIQIKCLAVSGMQEALRKCLGVWLWWRQRYGF